MRLDVGQSVEVGGYAFTFSGVEPKPGPNYRALVGTVEVRRDGKVVETLQPGKAHLRGAGQAMTEAAIDTGLFGDLYVALGEPVTETGVAGAWGVRVYVKPFIDWIWFGAS